jgi:chromosome segregation ATPase
MARSGLYKSEIKKARDSLIAQGINPSVDAVRIALGNTGSKTTIHKYLKELREEDGGADVRKASISEALQDLVARLATQLQDEANCRVDQAVAQGAEQERRHAEVVAALQQEIATLSTQLQRTEAATHEEKLAHVRTIEDLQNEKITRHTLDQQVADMKERLTENEVHRLSIEEKHQHARDALEHYRASVKEQRDQDQRRHEQQIQQIQAEMRQLQQSLISKQDDVTRLNQEGARLVADLSHAQSALYEQQARSRHLEQKLETLQAIEQHAKAAETRLADRDIQLQAQKEQLEASSNKSQGLAGEVRELELALAAADAKLAAQQGVVADLRAYLDVRGAAVEGRAK